MAMIDTLTKAQDDFFAAVEQTNERVVSTVRNVADNVERAAENVPELPLVNKMNLDNVQVPEFVQELPTPVQFTELYFDFVARSVEMNRAFAEQMLSIFVGGSTKKSTAKKSTAKKAAPKKAEAKKAEPQKAEAKKADSAKTDSAKADSAKTDSAKADSAS